MTIQGNPYTIKQINRAVELASAAVVKLPEPVGLSLIQFLVELYLGAIDADKQNTKIMSAS